MLAACQGTDSPGTLTGSGDGVRPDIESMDGANINAAEIGESKPDRSKDSGPGESGRLPTASLVLTTDAGPRKLIVEIASTPDQQAQGLMFRKTLGPGEGMVFPFRSPRIASFWMKNTLIALDMIFIRADGTIARIAANTVPHDLTPVSSGEPVIAVLEIAGGRARELGLKAGDHAQWSMPR